MKNCGSIMVALCFLVTTSWAGEGHDAEQKSDIAVPPFVDTVVHGTAMGAFTGLAAGWVRYADLHEMQNVWESVGYGALGGLSLGFTAAVLGPDGKGSRILGDIERSSGVGGGVGFMWGIVSALFTGDSRRIASSMAWGHLAGCVAGFGLAGYKIAAKKYDNDEEQTPGAEYSLDIMEDSAALPCAIARVTKRF